MQPASEPELDAENNPPVVDFFEDDAAVAAAEYEKNREAMLQRIIARTSEAENLSSAEEKAPHIPEKPPKTGTSNYSCTNLTHT